MCFVVINLCCMKIIDFASNLLETLHFVYCCFVEFASKCLEKMFFGLSVTFSTTIFMALKTFCLCDAAPWLLSVFGGHVPNSFGYFAFSAACPPNSGYFSLSHVLPNSGHLVLLAACTAKLRGLSVFGGISPPSSGDLAFPAAFRRQTPGT